VSDAGDAPQDAAGAASRALPERLAWNAPLVRALLARRDMLAHALLFAGPQGIGKRSLASEVAQALLCEAPRADGTACDACASCGYFAAGSHPDFRVIDRWKVDDDGELARRDVIIVDDVRDLGRLFDFSAHRGGNRVALIDPAEAMNRAAANALLKTLEEPPAGAYLLLVSHQSGRLPATIVSRCRRVVVGLPPRDAALAWLAAKGVEAPAELLAQAQGAPLAAVALADPSRQRERAAWLRALADPATLSPVVLSQRIDALPKDTRKSGLADAIDWLIGWSVDLARAAAGATPRVNVDYATPLRALAPKLARAALSRYHRTLLRQRARIAHPLTPRLTLEALLIDYRALFGHGSR
jgi:DNA polymerase III subunit delta'